ncbi:hypothetical protein [Lacrimispora saccharolytica]|nr:hypothetical protein [Lacrimispora saccharolytica]QRV18512.1 hypothetical protein I6K70_13290 [Lacrimispora saccharolytica]
MKNDIPGRSLLLKDHSRPPCKALWQGSNPSGCLLPVEIINLPDLPLQ